jgi:lysyl-tRNA synthetase class 1
MLMSHADSSADLARAGAASRAWPFEEARKVARRIEARGGNGPAVFETGYGPSGLPHIGTFGEVARTSMVRHAFEVLTEGRVATRLISFSDDLDGLRKVPDNVPNKDMLARYVEERDQAGRIVRNPTPLTSVPDPFGQHESFGHHNNAMLRAFLDRFGFAYEFMSSTETYRSGRFDETLLEMLELHERVRDIVLPLLGPERRKTYCPFLPILDELNGEKRRQVLHFARIVEARPRAGTAVFQVVHPVTAEPIGKPFEHSVVGGACKLQWRPDWAMRWAALGVDYEMSGKDLIDSVTYASRISKAIGATPPDGFNYELFLDEEGQKISKSRGNGLTIDEWLTYASPESLSLFMYQAPRKARRLYFDVIPKHVDDYLAHLSRFEEADTPEEKLANPVWHIHSGRPPRIEVPVSFNLLLNLASASNSEDSAVLWGFIRNYAGPDATPRKYPKLDELVGYAVAYFNDFVKPAKRYRAPDARERAALQRLADAFAGLAQGADGETIQNVVYEVGRQAGFEPLRDWFGAIYEVLLGQSQGPRFGSFVALYGIAETRDLIAKALEGALAREPL